MAANTMSLLSHPNMSSGIRGGQRISRSSPAVAGGRLVFNLATPRLPSRRHSTVVKALQTQEEKPAVAEVAESIGLPVEEGLFGFKPFPEIWVGRLAMMGFLTSMVEEFITGRGTLGQIGFDTPSQPLLITLTALAGGATLVATIATIVKAQTGEMTKRDAARYQRFFGLGKQNEAAYDATAADLKRRGDFTSPLNLADVNAAKAAGTPADAVLGFNDRDTADQEAGQMKAQAGEPNLVGQETEAAAAARSLKEREASRPAGPSVSLRAREDVLEQSNFSSADWNYARNIELTNGRYAMLGFLSAVLVEAATGHGILGQVIMYLKWSGVLGAASGF